MMLSRCAPVGLASLPVERHNNTVELHENGQDHTLPFDPYLPQAITFRLLTDACLPLEYTDYAIFEYSGDNDFLVEKRRG